MGGHARCSATSRRCCARSSPRYIPRHPLKREIIATHVLNRMVNRVGPTFVHRLTEMTGAKPAQIVRAYLATREVFGFGTLWKQIEALDNRVADAVQAAMFNHLRGLGIRATTWFLHPRRLAEGDAAADRAADAGRGDAARAAGAGRRRAAAGGRLGGGRRARGAGAGRGRHRRACSMRWTSPRSPSRTSCALDEIGDLHHELGERLGLQRLHQQIEALPADSYWDTLAKIALGDELAELQRSIALEVLSRREGSALQMLQAWEERKSSRSCRARGGCWPSWPTPSRPTWRCCRWRCASCATWPEEASPIVIEKVFAGIALAVCAVLLLRMAAAASASGWRVDAAWRSAVLSSRQLARRYGSGARIGRRPRARPRRPSVARSTRCGATATSSARIRSRDRASRIENISRENGFISSGSAAETQTAKAYGALKAAQIHIAKGLAKEKAKLHVRIKVMSPGTVYFNGGVWHHLEQGMPELFECTFEPTLNALRQDGFGPWPSGKLQRGCRRRVRQSRSVLQQPCSGLRHYDATTTCA